jgi:hypothetical protein
MTVPETSPQSAPLLTITWDTVIGVRTTRDHYDEEPVVEPVSLGEMVVAELAATLRDEIRRDVRDEVRKAVLPTIQAEVSGVVREALTGDIQRLNRWGEREGDKTTLRDMIADDVKAYLTEPQQRSSYDQRKGGFRELLREQVDDAMRKDLHATIAEARKQVVGQVQSKAAALIAGAVKDGLSR